MVLRQATALALAASTLAACTDLSLFDCDPPWLQLSEDEATSDGLWVGSALFAVTGELPHALTHDDDPRYDGDPLDALGADAWTTAPFCPEAGESRTPCGPGAIRDKLLRDPFVAGHPELR